VEEPRSASASPIPRLLLLGVIWGATFPIARVGVDGGANPFVLVAVVLFVAAAVMAPIARMTHTARPKWRKALQSAGLGALLIGGINLPLYWGLRFATGGDASIVYATSSIVSLVMLRLIGSPTGIRRRQVAAMALGLGGVLLLGIAPAGGTLMVGAAALAAFGLGATCQGVGAVLVGRARPHGEDRWGLTSQFVGGGIASLAILPFLAPAPAFPITAATLGSVAYVGLVSMVVGYTVFFDLIRGYGAVRANQVTFLNPVVALIVGVVAFAERFEPLEAVALAMILVALALLQVRSRPRPSSTNPSSVPRAPASVGPGSYPVSPPDATQVN
jgi:probable blue pigment (indigoidine) exporter